MAATNKAIIDAYKTENGLHINYPLFTYAAWLNQGYKVKNGEKSKHRVSLWKYAQRTVEQDGQEQTVGRCFFRTVSLFTMEQVERIG